MKGYVLTVESLQPLEIAQDLERTGILPEGKRWYFCWSETDIVLPSICEDFNKLFSQKWDTLRIFSEFVELRWEKYGENSNLLILCEDEGYRMLKDIVEIMNEACFTVEKGKRILAGKEMKLDGKKVRGKVSYPRVLNYGIDDDPKIVLLAAVNYYLDSYYMRRFVRYKSLCLSNKKELKARSFDRALNVLEEV